MMDLTDGKGVRARVDAMRDIDAVAHPLTALARGAAA